MVPRVDSRALDVDESGDRLIRHASKRLLLQLFRAASLPAHTLALIFFAGSRRHYHLDLLRVCAVNIACLLGALTVCTAQLIQHAGCR